MQSKFANDVKTWKQLRRGMEHFQGYGITYSQENALMPVIAQKAGISQPRGTRQQPEQPIPLGLYGTIKGITVRIKITTDKRGRALARDRKGRFAKRNLRE